MQWAQINQYELLKVGGAENETNGPNGGGRKT